MIKLSGENEGLWPNTRMLYFFDRSISYRLEWLGPLKPCCFQCSTFSWVSIDILQWSHQRRMGTFYLCGFFPSSEKYLDIDMCAFVNDRKHGFNMLGCATHYSTARWSTIKALSCYSLHYNTTKQNGFTSYHILLYQEGCKESRAVTTTFLYHKLLTNPT